MQVLALTVLVLSFSVTSVLSIHCYDCNSKFQPECKDPFNRYPLSKLNCDNKQMNSNMSNIPATYCRKVYQKVDEDIRIIRSCGYVVTEGRSSGCRRISPSRGVEIITCECSDDLCNESHKIRANVIFVILGITAFSVSRIFLT